MKKIAAVAVAVATMAVPGAAFAGTAVPTAARPQGLLPAELCGLLAPVVNVLSATPLGGVLCGDE